MSNELPRREVNSLLSYSSEDIVFERENNSSENNNGNNKNDNFRKNHDSDHRNNNQNGKDNNREKHKKFSNPVHKIITEESCYDKQQIYKALVKQDGLYKMIRDLKNWVKDPKKNKRPDYIRFCLKDIVVAAALPDAIDYVLKEEKYELGKKDFEPLMNEIVMVIKCTRDENDNLVQKYGKDSVEAIREAYISILYKLNKKKIKKFKEIDLDDGISKKLIVLTAGSPNVTIYQLLKYFYSNSNKLNMSCKTFIKILKICYGKSNMDEVIKCIMNEKINPIQSNPFAKMEPNKGESDMWVLIDQAMRDYLESMNTKDLKKVILAYVKERKFAKKRGDNVRRRFGDRRSIHPEDYPKLTKTLENLERDDFSIIEYLR